MIHLFNPTPIEEKMALGLARNWIMELEWTECDTLEDFRSWVKRGADKTVCFVAHQVEIEPYRVDFLIGSCDWNTKRPVMIAIECDGHEFHEKTKQQAAHDKKRDRYLALQGITTLRFTGSEIWADARKCGNEAATLMLERVAEVLEERVASLREERHAQS